MARTKNSVDSINAASFLISTDLHAQIAITSVGMDVGMIDSSDGTKIKWGNGVSMIPVLTILISFSTFRVDLFCYTSTYLH